MSGIAGIIYRNNKPVTYKQLEEMGAALAHRGPDGINYYCKDSVGFVHYMLHDTPESLFETLPNRAKNDDFVITFHGRIDNRQELYNKIGLTKPIATVKDSDFILAAYRKWRKDCVNHLLGDFAFAIWDQIERKLFCARDHIGVKPFYYFVDDKCFVFASEIRGLFAISEIPRILNEERVADYFTRIVIDKESTFYKNIFRLPPGHSLEIFQKRTLLTQYHIFRPAQLQCKSNNEYEECFREIFVDAVRVRLRSAFSVGSYLSGGLDSASIVCTAEGLLPNEFPGKLQTFSGVFDTIANCDERKYFSSVIKRYNLVSHTLMTDTINPALAFEKLIQDEDEPFLSPHIFMSMGLLPLVKESGVRVLLDGHDGDAAVSYGYSLLAESALSGNLLEFVRHYQQSGVKSFKIISRRLLSLYWHVLCQSIPASVPFSPAEREILRDLRIFNPVFAKGTQIKNRLVHEHKTQPTMGQKESEYHLKNISQSLHPFALELYDRVTVRFGVIARYPFFDRRVIEFCLGLPVNQKFQNGLNRSVVRRALADILPESIHNRRNKTDFTPSLFNAFRKNDQGWLVTNIDSIDESNYAILSKKNCLTTVASYKSQNTACMHFELRTLLLMVLFSRWSRRSFK